MSKNIILAAVPMPLLHIILTIFLNICDQSSCLQHADNQVCSNQTIFVTKSKIILFSSNHINCTAQELNISYKLIHEYQALCIVTSIHDVMLMSLLLSSDFYKCKILSNSKSIFSYIPIHNTVILLLL